MDKRLEKNFQSLIALKDLLNEVIQFPEKYLNQNNVLDALKSQGNLSKFHDPLKGIFPSSINTQKRISESMIEGGYETLNKLRAAAQLSIEKKHYENKKPKSDSKTGLLEKIKQQSNEISTIRNDLLLLTLAFERSLSQGLSYAMRADSSTVALCKKQQSELLDMLSLRKSILHTNLESLSHG